MTKPAPLRRTGFCRVGCRAEHMNQLTLPMPERRFDGETYDPQQDCARLTGQLLKVYDAMKAGGWHSLAELSDRCGGSEASISARIRDLRKARFGAHKIERQRQSPFTGVWIYRMTQ